MQHVQSWVHFTKIVPIMPAFSSLLLSLYFSKKFAGKIDVSLEPIIQSPYHTTSTYHTIVKIAMLSIFVMLHGHNGKKFIKHPNRMHTKKIHAGIHCEHLRCILGRSSWRSLWDRSGRIAQSCIFLGWSLLLLRLISYAFNADIECNLIVERWQSYLISHTKL